MIQTGGCQLWIAKSGGMICVANLGQVGREKITWLSKNLRPSDLPFMTACRIPMGQEAAMDV